MKVLGSERRVDLGDGRVAFIARCDGPYHREGGWETVVRVEKDGKVVCNCGEAVAGPPSLPHKAGCPAADT